MSKYRKRPVVVEATQWFRVGDHPLDNFVRFSGVENNKTSEPESLVVDHYLSFSKGDVCIGCGHLMRYHGWIETLEGGHIVCPGDFIITGVAGERYPCKPDIFAGTYELLGCK